MTDLTGSSQQPSASQEVPLPYVFFPKPNNADDLTVVNPTKRRLGKSPWHQTGDQQPSLSSKDERPLIMTPDERAWNNRLIKSFHTRRSLIDAIVLSPSGVVLRTLGRQVEVKVKDMDPGWWIGSIFSLLMVANFFLFIFLVGSGFVYIRIVKPFQPLVIEDWLSTLASNDIAEIECSITTTMSLFRIKSHITFYSLINDSSVLSSLFKHSNLRHNWEGLTENVIYIMTELLTGNKILQSKLGSGKGLTHHIVNQMERTSDITPVPHCFQNYNALRDVWINLYYQCILYIAVMLIQMYITVAEVLFKRLPHFAEPRDRELTPEQMRTRITIGLEGVASLQRICFFTKLILLMQALVIILFQRILVGIKNVEFNTRDMANRLQRAGLPIADVDQCTNTIYIAMACGTVQCLAIFIFHSLAKFYSTIASSKVPRVCLMPSQDESYIT